MKMTNLIIVGVLALLIGGGGGFYGGMQYEKGKQPTRATFRNGNFLGGFNVNGRIRGAGAFGGVVRGEVTSVNGTTMTVKLADGSSKIVILGGSTTVGKTTTGTTADVAVGQTVAATGTTNGDGSVTATTIEINPLTRAIGTPPAGTTPLPQ